MSEYSELLRRMKELEENYRPVGWPAIQMKDITTLCQMIEGAKILKKQPQRLEWNPDGYWLDGIFVGELETAFYEAGKKCSAEEKESKLPLSLLDSFIK